jgi:hypothetical protein
MSIMNKIYEKMNKPRISDRLVITDAEIAHGEAEVAKDSYKSWAFKIIERHKAGEIVAWMALKMARETFGYQPRQRNPGDDDEEFPCEF